MGIRISQKGDFKNTETYFINNKKSMFTYEQILDIAEVSLELFKKNTPSKSGETANSWSYTIDKENGKYSIIIHNNNIQNGYNIALLVDEGHALSDGRYVTGKHYIDNTIKEIFKYVNTIK